MEMLKKVGMLFDPWLRKLTIACGRAWSGEESELYA